MNIPASVATYKAIRRMGGSGVGTTIPTKPFERRHAIAAGLLLGVFVIVLFAVSFIIP